MLSGNLQKLELFERSFFGTFEPTFYFQGVQDIIFVDSISVNVAHIIWSQLGRDVAYLPTMLMITGFRSL